MANAAAEEKSAEKDDSRYKKLTSTNKNVIIRMVLEFAPDMVTDSNIAKAEVMEDADVIEEKTENLRKMIEKQSKKTGVDVDEATYEEIEKTNKQMQRLAERVEDQLDMFEVDGPQMSVVE